MKAEEKKAVITNPESLEKVIKDVTRAYLCSEKRIIAVNIQLPKGLKISYSYAREGK